MTFRRSELSPQQIVQLRAELERNLGRLERSLKVRSITAIKELDQAAVGRLSRVDALLNQGIAQQLEDRESARLGEIIQALRRLDDGSYGMCSDCRTPIRFERLMVFPETRTCTGCGGSQ